MTTAGVAQVKASLSHYLRRVKNGDEVIITERGKPVARLVPMARGGGPSEEDMQELYRLGLATPPKHKMTDEEWEEFWARPRTQDPEGLVLKALLEERESGW